MQLADEISKANFNEISEAITYAFARTAVRDALHDAIKATGATDWYGNTGCLPESSESFDKYWKDLREGNCELSSTAALSILNALLKGTHCELGRLGGKYAPAVLRHIKENMGQTMGLHSITIADDTVCGDIWKTTCILVEHYLDGVIPDNIAEVWEEEIASWPK